MYGMAVSLALLQTVAVYCGLKKLYIMNILIVGKIRPATEAEYHDVSTKFTSAWIDGNPPTVSFVFAINNRDLSYKCNAYKQKKFGLKRMSSISMEAG